MPSHSAFLCLLASLQCICVNLCCQSANPIPSLSSAACRAWQCACTANSPWLLQAEGGQSGGPHKGAGLMGHVYTRKLEQAQQVRTQPINFVCASLSASFDWLSDKLSARSLHYMPGRMSCKWLLSCKLVCYLW
jgi:hypothetical protein